MDGHKVSMMLFYYHTHLVYYRVCKSVQHYFNYFLCKVFFTLLEPVLKNNEKIMYVIIGRQLNSSSLPSTFLNWYSQIDDDVKKCQIIC